ncbi:MAG TPA: carboxypeptidase-like regulatory domain-containing protein [Terriglobia bacterium]|nr:carboxypeptidase-like regulatory domain-containing protein [Terriglobia bacterium]
MNFLRIAILATLTLPVAAQQVPLGGSVRGTIFKTDTGGPVSSAMVELKRVGGDVAEVYSVQTSGDGTFQIVDVPRGEYRLAAKLGGYVTSEYGQHRWSGAGVPLVLDPGQSLEDLNIELTPSGSIAGRIFDRDGDPIGAAVVQAIASSYRDGKRVLQIVQSANSNDLGEYRLFGLRPGRYYLSATPSANSGLPQPLALDSRVTSIVVRPAGAIVPAPAGQAPIFYPGTADVRAASAIELAAGATVSGNNFSISPAQRHHVRGVVSGTSVQLLLAPMNPSPGVATAPRNFGPRTEAFDFPDVIPGDYMLIAQSVDKEAKLRIDVRDADINDIRVELRAGVIIPTHVTIEGRARAENNPDFRFIRFNFMPDPKIEGIKGPIYSTFPDGSVNFEVTPGEGNRISLVAVADAPPEFQNLYIKSIQMGTRDVLNDGLQFNGEINPKVEIIIGTKPGSLSGSVVNSRQRPSVNTTVVLVPPVAARARPDAYKVATTDASGRFQIALVPPGDYKVFAWDDVQDGAWQDPEFLSRYEDSGKRIQIGESGKETVTLQATPSQ